MAASRKVITYGTFDLFHIGHLHLLERARQHGDELIVAVSTDEFNLTKGKKCAIPFLDRARIVGGLKCVSSVIPERCWEQKTEDVRFLEISILTMGDDWSGKFDFLKPLCDVVYLPRTMGVSSTEIKVRLSGPQAGMGSDVATS